MEIMQCRYSTLERTLAGYDATGVPLIARVNDSMYPAGSTDDPGIYYFIPSIAHWLGLSTSEAINLFFYALIGVGFMMTTLCFMCQCRTILSRAAALALISATFMTIRSYADVYLLAPFAVFTLVPWFMFKSYALWARLLILGGAGILVGYSNLTRAHAGTGMLVFILSWLALHPSFSRKDKLIGLITLTCFTSIPYAHFHQIIEKRDAYLTTQNPAYRPLLVTHPKWHSIYIGLGFLENPYGITYSDTIADNKVKSINPNVAYCSAEYDAILRDECFKLLKQDPWFIIKTIAAKSFKLFCYLIYLSNASLIAFFYLRPSIRQILPFLLAISFYCLPGILTIPTIPYVLGATSMLAILMIYLVCMSLDKYVRSVRLGAI